MLNMILAISGKPGLYKLVSQAKNMLIVETVSADRKRMPIYASDKVISLGDIAMYTDAEEVALSTVLESVKNKENGEVSSFNYKKASPEEDKIAAAELCSVYHGVKHGHSYLSTDCGNKVSAKIFNDSSIATKMSCGRTKSEALVQNVHP